MASTATGERTIPVSQSNGSTASPPNTYSTVASPTTNYTHTQKSLRRPSPRVDSPMEASSSSYVRGTLVLMMFMVLVVMVVVSMIVAVIVVVIPVIMVMMLATVRLCLRGTVVRPVPFVAVAMIMGWRTIALRRHHAGQTADLQFAVDAERPVADHPLALSETFPHLKIGRAHV